VLVERVLTDGGGRIDLGGQSIEQRRQPRRRIVG
jgi:hypothetical protein